MKYFKEGFLIMLIIGALYLIVSCIVSIPLMDENNTKVKDLSNNLQNELKSIRITFDSHLDEFFYDSLTLSRYDETAKAIQVSNSSARLKNYLSLRIRNYKRSMENAADLFIYKFNAENHDYSYKAINQKKNIIVQQFKKNCDSAEREVTNTYLAVMQNINTLYSISRVDSSKNYEHTKGEFRKINTYLFFTPLQPDYGANLDSMIARKNSSMFFKLSETLIEKNSSSLVVILGMLGMSFLGAIVSVFRKNDTSKFNIDLVTGRLFTILLISVSSSLITYLSLQGGVTLLTVGNDVKLNPYLILCFCFAASVYSEDIWIKVKTWFG